MNKPILSTENLKQVVDMDRSHVWHHLVQHKPVQEGAAPMFIVAGQGLRVRDASGKEYIDAVSGGVWTVNVGYGRESIANAVRDQLVEMCYFSNSAGNIPGAKLADKLIEKMPGLSRVYFSTSGSEANEKGFKLVRQLAAKENGGKKHKIIYRDRDYHGTTITTLSACGQHQRKDQYGPFTPGFVEFPHCLTYHHERGDDPDFGVVAARELERVILEEGPDTVGAVILEAVTAGGGVIPPPEGYFDTIQEICTKYGVLIHMDEVVCGMGRTGKWFGYQHYNIKPDIVVMAKGVASGYAAIACTVTTEELFKKFLADPSETMQYFRDISTFGGCAGGPAAALENVRIIEEERLLENVVAMGDYLMDRLLELKDKHPIVGDVRGKGLFAGAELVADRKTRTPVDETVMNRIVGDCLEQGVMIGRTNRSFQHYNNTICLSPALICTRDDVDEIVTSIDKALGRIQL